MKHQKLKTAIRSICISLVIYLVMSFTIVMLIYEGMFARTEEYGYSLFISRENLEQVFSARDISFDSRGFKVSSVIYGECKDKLVILAHAKDSSSADMHAEALFFLKNGFSVMTMDFVGHSKSGGNSQYGLQQGIFDLENAISYAVSEGYENVYLYGIGIGGYAAAACADKSGVKGVAAISSFSNVSDMTVEYAVSHMSIFGYLEYPVMMLYQYLVYGSDLEKSAINGINNASVPVIVINGTDDEVVKYDGAALINSADRITNPDVVYKTVDNGVHLSLMRSEKARELIEDFNQKAYELYNKYEGNVPTADIEELYASYNPDEINSLDENLMNDILSVFGCV